MRSPVRGVLGALGAIGAALTLTACTIGAAPPDRTASGPSGGGSVSVAVSDSWTAYNAQSLTGGTGGNLAVTNLIQSSFWGYDADGTVVRNEEFGTFEKIADDPLTVEYTFHPDAAWSDGTPIDYDDALLAWATASLTYVDDNGAPLFDTYGTAAGAYQQQPEGEPGDKTFTLVYSEPTPEWEQGFAGVLPAHVVAEQAGMTPEELVQALEDRDAQRLAPAAEFWNEGWQFRVDAALPDAALIPSSGPFTLSSNEPGSLILARNDAYWGTPAQLDTLVLRTLDQAEHVSALLNGDVDVISPQANADTYGQLVDADGITTLTGDAFVYDHLDFDFTSPVFASEEARAAFALCIPREQIVENLYVPVNPDATVTQLREFFPFEPTYEAALAGVPSAERYLTTDVEAARELLDASGVADPSVTLLTNASTPRYVDMARMIEASCTEAGFDITLDLDAAWSDKLAGGSWDAVLFQWSGSGSVTATELIYVTDGQLNFGGYSDPDVDRLWGEVRSALDLDEVVALKTEMEERLWATIYSVPIAVQPSLTAVSERVSGVVHNSTNTGVLFNAAQWTVD